MTDLAHRQMRSLRLCGEALASPEDVVRWLGAVQSQDYGPVRNPARQRPARREPARSRGA